MSIALVVLWQVPSKYVVGEVGVLGLEGVLEVVEVIGVEGISKIVGSLSI